MIIYDNILYEPIIELFNCYLYIGEEMGDII